MSLAQSAHGASGVQAHLPSPAFGWLGSALVVAVGVLVLMTNLLMPTLVGVYVDCFGLSMREAGYTAAVYMLGGGLGALCVSATLFSVRTRGLLVVGLCALAAGNLASLYTQSFGMILAVRLLAGMGEGVGFALMAAGVSRMRNPSRVYGIYVVAVLLTAAAVQCSVPWIRGVFGPKALFVPIAILPLVVLLFLRWFPDLSRPQASIALPKSEDFYPIRTGYFWCGALGTLIIYCANGGTFAYLERAGVLAGIDRDSVARTLAVAQLGGAGGALASVLTADVWRREWKIVITLVLVTSATLAIFSGRPWGFTLGVIAWFFLWEYFVPNLLGVLSLADPGGRLAAASMGTMEWGLAIGPVIVASSVMDGGGYAAVGLVTVVGYVAGVALLVPVMLHISRDAKSQCREGATVGTAPSG
jgi:MFS transporter, DHA1 family, inner membrane transport protein